MKFLFMSDKGMGLSTAFRVKSEGNDVKVWIRLPQYKHLWDGLLKKVKRWGEALEPERVVVFDSEGGERTAERLRTQNYLVVGGGEWKGQTPVEEEVEGWFSGSKFAQPVVKSKTWRKFLTGDLGRTVGCAGVLSQSSYTSPLAEMESGLREIGYCGPVSVSEGRVRLSFTYDHLQTLIEGLTKDVGEVLFETAGNRLKVLPLEEGWFVGVRLTVPPYPANGSWKEEEIGGLSSEDREHVHFYEIGLRGDKPMFVGPSGLVLVMTGSGETPEKAASAAYQRLERVQLKDKQYRVDVGYEM